MKFTKEQVLSFSTNWKQFHSKGLHKVKPVIIECGFPATSRFYTPPQTHMRSDMRFLYYVLYNYLRNLPLERGVSMKANFPSNINELSGDYNIWNLSRMRKRLETSSDSTAIDKLTLERANIIRVFTDIFGDAMTEDILMEFIEALKNYTYEPV